MTQTRQAGVNSHAGGCTARQVRQCSCSATSWGRRAMSVQRNDRVCETACNSADGRMPMTGRSICVVSLLALE